MSLREELQIRIAIFSSSASLSGAVSGLLAYWLIKMDGIRGIPGWGWIFIVGVILDFDELDSAYSIGPVFQCLCCVDELLLQPDLHRWKESSPRCSDSLGSWSFHFLHRLVVSSPPNKGSEQRESPSDLKF